MVQHVHNENRQNRQRFVLLLRFRMPKGSLEGVSLESRAFNLIIKTNKPGTFLGGSIIFRVKNLGRMRTRGDPSG